MAEQEQNLTVFVNRATGEPVRRRPLPPSVGLVASFSPHGKQLGFGGWGGHDTLDIRPDEGRTRCAPRRGCE